MGRIVAAVMMVAAGAWLAWAQQDTGEVIRAEAKLVRLLATVKTASGQLVGGLDQDEFEVTDEGVAQRVAVFERQTVQPLSIAVLVDASGSTKKDVRIELDAVKRFFRAVLASGNEEDQVSLYSFNYEVRQMADFTRNLSLLERRLDAMESTAGTSLYDALYFSSLDIEEREGRHALIVVTDGGDTTSGKTFQAARLAVQRAEAAMYSVLITPVKGDAGRNLGGENALQLLSESTGGAVFRPLDGKQMDGVFASILRDLRTQYLLGYYPQGVRRPKDGYHRVEVKVKRPGLVVSARTGYFDK